MSGARQMRLSGDEPPNANWVAVGRAIGRGGARVYFARHRKKRAARAHQKKDAPSAPSRHRDNARRYPIERFSQWRTANIGKAGDRACLFRSKTYHYAPLCNEAVDGTKRRRITRP